MAVRTGFTIPNAGDVPGTLNSLRQAEPDAVDFLTLGDNRYGVLSGCSGAVASSNFTLTSGPDAQHVVVVNGSLIPAGSVAVSVPLQGGTASLDRFDLVIFDASEGRFRLLVGTAAASPVFPTLQDDQVVLYAIFVSAGILSSSITTSMVTDKRIRLTRNYITAIPGTERLLANTMPDGSSPYTVYGDGRTSWNDVSLYRTSTGTVEVGGNLNVTGNEAVVGNLGVSGNLAAGGVFTSANIVRGTGIPSGVAAIGTIYQQVDGGGKLWLYQETTAGTAWARIGTDMATPGGVTAGDPPGTIISSLLAPGHPFLSGFLPMVGNSYGQTDLGRLWSLRTTAPFVDWMSGLTMVIPDMTGSTLMQTGETIGLAVGSNERILTTSNLPAHQHFGGDGTTGSSGAHTPTGGIGESGGHSHTTAGGGGHYHTINDPGHAHGTDFLSGGYIRVQWNGAFRLDGPFTDASHPIAVDQTPFVSKGFTGINQTTSEQSGHDHNISGHAGHSHPLTMNSVPGHTHSMPAESSVGGGTPINLTPRRLPIRYYIKT